MTARRELADEVAFAAEGLAASAAATALRRVRGLAEGAPAGRMFAAIATLTEMSRRSEAALDAGREALRRGDEHAATLNFARAIVHMDALAAEAAGRGDAQAEPGYLKRRR